MNFNGYVKNIYTKNPLNEGSGNYAYDVFTKRNTQIYTDNILDDYESDEEYPDPDDIDIIEEYIDHVKTEIIEELEKKFDGSPSSNRSSIVIVFIGIDESDFPIFVRSGLNLSEFRMQIQLTVKGEHHYSNDLHIDGEIEYYSEYYNNGNFNAESLQYFVEDVVAYEIEISDVEYDEDEIKEFEDEMIQTIKKIRGEFVDEVEEIISDTIKRLSYLIFAS